MSASNTVNLFLSYSHLDEDKVKEFSKHLAPLKTNGLINEWYDRKLIAGQDFQDTIDNNLKKADIICLFISANFLASKECVKEKDKAIDLRKKKGITVIPIILSSCGWLDLNDLKTLLALPTDGKPIEEFPNSSFAWHIVYEGIKVAIEQITKIKSIELTDQFEEFLRSTELLSKAHSQKSLIEIEDIFVYPDLIKYDDILDFEKSINSETVIKDFLDYAKILIAGEDQSGKTALCKMVYVELRKKDFVPVYITDRQNHFLGAIDNRIKKSIKEQYKNIEYEDLDINRIVPIIDDFHYAKHMEKHINHLEKYPLHIIIVDDVFSLNFIDERLLESYNKFRIKEFGPYLRNKLIEKWIELVDSDPTIDKNKIYREIDNTTDLINSTLGKVFSSGIMPSYPFFILTILSTHETFEKPLDQEITSQGYCYQALIYLYLRKNGVKNDEIDTYINYLTEFAFYLFSNSKSELNETEFNKFLESYLAKFNLPIKHDLILKNLQQTRIIAIDSFSNLSFGYSYLYFFFVGKYLAEHLLENKKTIDSILNNLHVNANAYIAIFISHHSRNSYVLDEIVLNSMCLFEKNTPTTLSKDELSFFDNQLDIIVRAALPSKASSPELEREKRLKAQEEIENFREDELLEKPSTNKEDDPILNLAKELRRSVKTVEVMGSIIKNRAGSLEKSVLETVFLEAMNVHLKILDSFFEIIKDEDQQTEIVDILSLRLEEIIKDKPKMPDHDHLVKISKSLFWNMNFSVVYGFINKIIHSLGSNKLSSIIETVCDRENTPAAFLVKHGILLWYYKNLRIDEIADRIRDDGFSDTAKSIMKFMIASYCSLHPVGYKDLQRIEQRLGIPSRKLIQRNS
jgi:hypothetical protein